MWPKVSEVTLFLTFRKVNIKNISNAHFYYHKRHITQFILYKILSKADKEK